MTVKSICLTNHLEWNVKCPCCCCHFTIESPSVGSYKAKHFVLTKAVTTVSPLITRCCAEMTVKGFGQTERFSATPTSPTLPGRIKWHKMGSGLACIFNRIYGSLDLLQPQIKYEQLQERQREGERIRREWQKGRRMHNPFPDCGHTFWISTIYMHSEICYKAHSTFAKDTTAQTVLWFLFPLLSLKIDKKSGIAHLWPLVLMQGS